MLRSGQAMIETVLAVLIITFVFLGLFKLSHMLTGKIMLEHAAMRVARARAVGFNDFMCVKTARAAVRVASCAPRSGEPKVPSASSTACRTAGGRWNAVAAESK